MPAPGSPSEGRRSSKLAPDRVALPAGVLLGMLVATAMSVGLAARTATTQGQDPSVALLGGAVSGALAVGALRSLSVRAVTRWMVIIGALLLLRFGSSSIDDAEGALLTLGWIASTAAALVLAARAERWTWRQGAKPPRSGRRRLPGADASRLARIVTVVVCLVAAAGVGLGPAVAAGFASGPDLGARPSFNAGTRGSAVAATERLDMTTRPRLSDAVVLKVTSDVPSFWRSQTFDEWDGQQWTRSTGALNVVPASGAITPAENDLAATTGTSITQDITVEASFLNALPAAPSAVTIDAPSALLQWEDGSVAANEPMGKGARYRVVSRQQRDLSAPRLRAADSEAAPAEILERYAADPVTTERVRRLAAQITQDATTAYDKAAAIEAWLDANTKYSLDAPLAPKDADVVDDFLFVSKLGWCEQIASSFTVLLRASGVPARLAVGYVPERRDLVTQQFLVRERDAHAWTEVWFPSVGWVQFDPTAGITMSGDVPESLGTQLSRYGSWALLAIAVVLSLGGPVISAVSAMGRAIGRARPLTAIGRSVRRRRGGDWTTVTEAGLEQVGRRWGRAREPAETTTAYARELGARVGDDRLALVGELVDRERYSAESVDPAERDAVAAVLSSVRPPATP